MDPAHLGTPASKGQAVVLCATKNLLGELERGNWIRIGGSVYLVENAPALLLSH